LAIIGKPFILKQILMKKFLTLTLVGMFVALAMTACKTSKGSCEAYGSIETVENADLASK
jgi:hypothetical protein